MSREKKIAWQKYEDYIEKQISSPVVVNILQNIISLQQQVADDESEEDIDDEDDYEDIDISQASSKIIAPLLPINNQIIEDLSMLSSFDCWIGHTNFDITQNVKNILDEITGIELLKIYSRYRFFIGIGRLFDFKDVRKDIEDSLIEGD